MQCAMGKLKDSFHDDKPTLFLKVVIPLGQQLIPTEGGNFFRHLLRNCYLSLREKLALCAISKGFPFVRKLSAVG